MSEISRSRLGLKARVWRGLGTVYRRLPVSHALRLRLKDALYTAYGKMFPASMRYREYLDIKSRRQDPTNPFAGVYPWDYLKPENSDRPAILESIVEPYIHGNEAVFEICCGFSPLSRFLLEKHCCVVGFDISHEVIEYCKRAYPRGTYYVADDASVEIPRHVDVLVHLGIAPGTDRWGLESRTEVATSLRAIRQTLPRLIVVESAMEFSAGFDQLKGLISDLNGYGLLREVPYEFHLNVSSINPAGAALAYKRVLAIFHQT